MISRDTVRFGVSRCQSTPNGSPGVCGSSVAELHHAAAVGRGPSKLALHGEPAPRSQPSVSRHAEGARGRTAVEGGCARQRGTLLCGQGTWLSRLPQVQGPTEHPAARPPLRSRRISRLHQARGQATRSCPVAVSGRAAEPEMLTGRSAQAFCSPAVSDMRARRARLPARGPAAACACASPVLHRSHAGSSHATRRAAAIRARSPCPS